MVEREQREFAEKVLDELKAIKALMLMLCAQLPGTASSLSVADARHALERLLKGEET